MLNKFKVGEYVQVIHHAVYTGDVGRVVKLTEESPGHYLYDVRFRNGHLMTLHETMLTESANSEHGNSHAVSNVT